MVLKETDASEDFIVFKRYEYNSAKTGICIINKKSIVYAEEDIHIYKLNPDELYGPEEGEAGNKGYLNCVDIALRSNGGSNIIHIHIAEPIDDVLKSFGLI